MLAKAINKVEVARGNLL